jgi:hypothetical protein
MTCGHLATTFSIAVPAALAIAACTQRTTAVARSAAGLSPKTIFRETTSHEASLVSRLSRLSKPTPDYRKEAPNISDIVGL